MKAYKLDLMVGVLVVLTSMSLFVATFYFPPPLGPHAPGPAIFPRIIIFIMFLFGALLTYSSLTSSKKEARIDLTAVKVNGFLLSVGLIVLYLFLLPYLGFVWDSFLYLCLTLFPRMKSKFKVVLVSAIGVACFYLIFVVLLRVRLPLLVLPGGS